MGKSLFIGVLVLTVVFAAIIVTVQRHSSKVPEMLSVNLAEQQAKALGNYALIYGIRQLMDGKIFFSEDTYLQEFGDFIVFDGTIDSIKYFVNTDDWTIQLKSYVFCDVLEHQVHHQSEAVLDFNLSNITSAVATSGSIVVKGDAEVNGVVIQDSTRDFEEIFGMSEEAMRDTAVNLYVDPPNNVTPVNGITWVDIISQDNLTISDYNWEGSGILIVNGDLRFTGGHFEGIIWVMGELYVGGNTILDGTIFVACSPEIENTFIGTSVVNFDILAISQALSNLESGSFFKITMWNE